MLFKCKLMHRVTFIAEINVEAESEDAAWDVARTIGNDLPRSDWDEQGSPEGVDVLDVEEL